MNKLRQLALSLLLMLSINFVHAIPIELSFTVAGFPVSAPTDPVTGTIVYEAASLGATVDSLTSISLTLDGYTYGVGELGFTSSGSTDFIGGSLNGVQTIFSATNDFLIRFNRDAQTGFDFIYSSASINNIWSSAQFTSFSMTELSQVPEPTTVALLSLGLVGFGFTRRKMKA